MLKNAERAIFWHGTSSSNLRSILKKGLVASTKNKMYDNQSSGTGTRSIDTYGGIYFSNRWMDAYSFAGNASRKVGGNRLIIAATLETRSPKAMLDEDTVLSAIERGVGGNRLSTALKSGILRYQVENLTDMWGETIRVAKLEDFISLLDTFDYSQGIERFVKYTGEKVRAIQARIPEKVNKLISESLKYFILHLLEMDYKDRAKNDDDFRVNYIYLSSLHLFDKLVQTVTELSSTLKDYEEDTFSKRIRFTEDIGFSGKNKILFIAEIIEDPKPDKIKVYRGQSYLPLFLQGYKSSIGSNFEIL